MERVPLGGEELAASLLAVDQDDEVFDDESRLLEQFAVLPHHSWSPEKAHRTFSLAAGGVRIVAIDEQTALIRDADGAWRSAGAGTVTVYLDGQPAGLDALSD